MGFENEWYVARLEPTFIISTDLMLGRRPHHGIFFPFRELPFTLRKGADSAVRPMRIRKAVRQPENGVKNSPLKSLSVYPPTISLTAPDAV